MTLAAGTTLAGYRIDGVAGVGDGRRVPRDAPRPRHRLRAQGDRAGARLGPVVPRPLQARVPDRGVDPPSQRHPDPPRGRGGRPALPGHGPGRGQRPARAARARRPDARRPRGAYLRAGCGRAGRRACPRPRPPRHQAGEHPRRARDRPPVPHRLRAQQEHDLGRRPDQDRTVARHGGLRRSGADPRLQHRRADRRLRARLSTPVQ